MKATPQQVEQFRRFALERIGKSGTGQSIDELYDRWRLECPSEEEFNEDLLAIKASLEDMEQGATGKAFEEFAGKFRATREIDPPQ